MPTATEAPRSRAVLRTCGHFADAEEAISFLFFDSDDDPLVQYAETWLEEASLRAALSYDSALVAAARGPRIWLSPTEDGRAGVAVTLQSAGESCTCLSWLAFARSATTPPDVALCVGTTRGRVLLYAADGELIHAQRLHDTSAVSVACRSAGGGASCDDASEDVCVAFADHVARLDVLALAALVRRHALHRRNAPLDEEWVSREPLAAVKWDLGRVGASGIADAALAGALPASLYDALTGAGGPASHAMCLLNVGEAPAVGVWAGPEAESGVLAAAAALAVTAVTAVASGVFSLLSSPWGSSKPPAAKATAGSAAQAGAGDEMPSALAASHRATLDDAPRRGRGVALAPRGGLAATTDSLGRVMLLDLQAAPLCAVRLWKGYRDARVSWVDGPSRDDPARTPPPLCLAVHAPHRGGLLELWGVRHGPRVAKLRCGANCRLLSACPLLCASTPALYSCYILDGCSGELKVLDFAP